MAGNLHSFIGPYLALFLRKIEPCANKERTRMSSNIDAAFQGSLFFHDKK
jgi:hypothetical protein